MSTDHTEGINLDAASVRSEFPEALAAIDGVGHEVRAVIDELTDVEINAIVLDTVDDAFLEAYEAARKKIVARIITMVTSD